MKYRKLEPNEVIQEGDRYLCDSYVSDGVFQRQAIYAYTGNFGRKVGDCEAGFWRRPVEEDWFIRYRAGKDGWISMSDRRPTKDDYGADGYHYERYLLFFEDGRVQVGAENSRISTNATHWMPMPRPPAPVVRRVKVRGEDVVPQPDGSVKVGCTTIVRSEFNEIVRQWSAMLEARNREVHRKLDESAK